MTDQTIKKEQLSLPEIIARVLRKFSPGKETILLAEQTVTLVQQIEARCETEADGETLGKLFQKVDMGSFTLVSPEQTELSIHEMTRMSELGIHVGCIDPIKIEHKKGRFKVFQILEGGDESMKIEIFPPNWDQTFRCALHPKGYPKLFENRKRLLASVKKIYKGVSPEHVRKNQKLIRQYACKYVGSALWDFPVPNESDLTNPKAIGLKHSLLLKEEGKAMKTFFSENGESILRLQRSKRLPSLFNSSDFETIQGIKPEILFLIEAGSSMKQGELFKKIQCTCEKLKARVLSDIPAATLRFMPYDSQPMAPRERFERFECSDRVSKTAVALQDVYRSIPQDSENAHIIIHICNSQINDVSDLLKVAKLLPKKQIIFYQVLVGHETADLAESLLQKEALKLGAKEKVTLFDKRERAMVEVTEAANGDLTTIWNTQKLGGALLSVLDLAIGEAFELKSLAPTNGETPSEDDYMDAMF